jgi:hypothetical protein
MKPYTCPICGGKLNIRIGADQAECDSCGRFQALDAADVARYREIFIGAERAMRQNTAAGYEDAIRQLQAIAFIDEARDKIKECEQRLNELRADRLHRQEANRLSDRRNTRLGIVLLILTLLLCAAALAGIVYLVVRFVQGTLSKGAMITILAVALAAIVVSVLGKLFAGRGSDSK